MAECSIAVFDLGGVLIDWNPRHLYRKLFDGDTEAMEEFLAAVCTQSIDHALTIYIDDREPNVKAAMAFGMRGIVFTDAAALRTELIGLGLLH
jgi:FMN phosphatase YigB (HAD superfamily)